MLIHPLLILIRQNTFFQTEIYIKTYYFLCQSNFSQKIFPLHPNQGARGLKKRMKKVVTFEEKGL